MKSPAAPSPIPGALPLRKPRHEAFARLYATGKICGAKAYAAVYGSQPSTAQRHASRLRARPDVSARLRYLQSEVAATAVMDLREILEFLTRVKRTPIGQVDTHSQVVRRIRTGRRTKTIWMLDKYGCLQLAARLLGFLPSPRSRRPFPLHPPPAAPAASQPLRNSRHEAFVRLLATGQTGAQACMQVYGVMPRIGESYDWRLRARPDIAARLRYLQSEAANPAVLTLREILEFLTAVMRTPAGQLDENSELIQRITFGPKGKNIWMLSKRKCVELLAKLQGFFHSPINYQPSTINLPPKVLTEERRAELMAKKRASLERRLSSTPTL